MPPGSVGVARLPLPDALRPTPLPAEPPRRLLAAGRASHEKGFDVLVDALALPAASEWHATLVTEGPERAAFEAQVRAHGVESRVTFGPLRLARSCST